MNCANATVAVFVVLVLAVAADACVHRPSAQAGAAAASATEAQARGAAQVDAGAEAEVESRASVRVHRGGLHLHEEVRPSPDGGAPLVDIDLIQDAEDFVASAGAEGAAGAVAMVDAGATASADAGAAAVLPISSGGAWRWWMLAAFAVAACLTVAAARNVPAVSFFLAAVRRIFGG